MENLEPMEPGLIRRGARLRTTIAVRPWGETDNVLPAGSPVTAFTDSDEYGGLTVEIDADKRTFSSLIDLLEPR